MLAFQNAKSVENAKYTFESSMISLYSLRHGGVMKDNLGDLSIIESDKQQTR